MSLAVHVDKLKPNITDRKTMSGLPPNPTIAAANGSASTPSQVVSATASSPVGGAAGPATPAGYAHLPTNPITTGAAAAPGNGTLVQGVQPTGMASPMSMQSAMGFNAGMAAHQGMAGPMMGGMDQQPKRAHLYVGNLSGRVTEYSEFPGGGLFRSGRTLTLLGP